MTCVRCGAALSPNETGLNRKFCVGEGEYCLPCLAKKLHVPEERLKEKIRELAAAGCRWFTAE